MTNVVKVKRDGPRGWHWIDASKYDPNVHDLADEPKLEAPVSADGIQNLNKPEVVQLLEDHGIEFDKRTGVADLRVMLTKTMFGEA